MKILFVSRNKTNNQISPIVKNQGKSLEASGEDLTYFIVEGTGIKGYIKSSLRLKKHLKANYYDIIHAHYSLSGFMTSLAGAKPLIVSLMGSDVKSKSYYRFIIKFFGTFFWSKTIVKSEDMKKALGTAKVSVIPNGVNFEKFKPIAKEIALLKTKWDTSKKHVLFAANPNRTEKNFKLAKEAFELLDRPDTELHYLKNVPNDKMIYYYNSSDVVLLSSLWEGSPNVIKEAMACNIPIVVTDVGDVKQVIGETDGCHICTFETDDVAGKLEKALAFSSRTCGRMNIQNLDSREIAKQIILIYKSLL